MLYDSKRGKPYTPGLAYLAKTYLKREIQVSDKGHNPVEDARAAIDLVNLKVKNGENFGRSVEECHTFCGRLQTLGTALLLTVPWSSGSMDIRHVRQ